MEVNASNARSTPVFAGAVLLCTAVHGVHAQDTTTVRCAGQRIDRVAIHASAPSAALLRRVHLMDKIVGAIHTTTNIEIIRRFVAVQISVNSTERECFIAIAIDS